MVVEELLISRDNPAFFSNFLWVLAGLDCAEKTEKNQW